MKQIEDKINFALALLTVFAILVACVAVSSCTTAYVKKSGVIYTDSYDTVVYRSTYTKSINK